MSWGRYAALLGLALLVTERRGAGWDGVCEDRPNAVLLVYVSWCVALIGDGT